VLDSCGHDWEEPRYKWVENPDGSKTVTAKRVCKRSEEHVETESVQAVQKITKPETYAEEGETVFSASFVNTVFVEQTKSESIPAKPACGDADVYLTWDLENGVLTVRVKKKDENDGQTGLIQDCTVDGIVPEWKIAAEQLSQKGKPVTKIVITEGITQIGANSFSELPYVKEIVIAEGATQIGDNAFGGDLGIEKIALPNSLKKISSNAFEPNVATEASINYAGDDQQWIILTEGSLLADNNNLVTSHEHTWSDEYTIDIPATCIREGQQSIHCSTCGAINEATITTIPKTGQHAYGEWKTTKESTCEEAGSKEKVCIYCLDKVTEVIPALGHTWNEDYTVDKVATCTQEGSKSIHCAICDAVKKNSEITTSATGHLWGNPIYTWSEDNASVTVACTCLHDRFHKETETVNTVSKVTRAATYTVNGETTYTAEFSNPLFTGQVRTVNNIAKLQMKENHCPQGFYCK